MTLSSLFLDLNSFFASVEQADNFQLRGKPVAVVPVLADSSCCIAASYQAKAFGVSTGTRVSDAKKLCPNIRFIVGDHRKYVQYHHKIVSAVDLCLPVTKVHSIDEMHCELTGSHQREEVAIEKAKAIKKSIYKNAGEVLSCSIGIAPNSYIGKMASNIQKPDGLVVIKQNQIPEILYSLELNDFPGIGSRMEKRFFHYGCHTVRELYKLSIEEMREVWGGVLGEEFWRKIRGEILPEKETSTKSIGHSRIIPPQHRRDRAYIKSMYMQLITKACVRMRDAGLYATKMYFQAKYIEMGGQSYWDKKITFEETQNTLFFTSELQKIIRKLPTGTIIKVGVTLFGFTNKKVRQLSLFEDTKAEPLMNAVDSINKKHGGNLVFPASAKLQDDRTPLKIAFTRIPGAHE